MKWALFLGTVGAIPVVLIALCSTYKYKYPESNVFLLNYTFIYTLSLVFSVICGCSYVVILIGMGEYIT
jgi:hypothetical protein